MSQAQCDALTAAGLSDRLLFPGDAAYEARLESWWSVQNRLRPSCIFQPSTTEDVSLGVSALSRLGSGRYAIRSGGHCAWAGGSNVEGGITIDLGKLDQVTYHEERAVASIGPGQTWGTVYDVLESQGILVAGGRVRDVGVGGLVTGGGISYHTGIMGFACDTVVNFQVVLADGRIVDANATSNPDLWKALKGGSGNLGIVTRIDMEAFPTRKLWGGLHFSDKSKTVEVINTLVRFTETFEDHPEAAYTMSFVYKPVSGSEDTFVNQVLVNTSGAVDPPLFRDIQGAPNFFNDLQERSLSDFVNILTFPAGFANVWTTLTFKNDARIVHKSVELHDALIADLLSVVPAAEMMVQTVWQPMPRRFSDISVSKGGNMLGLDAAQGDCLLWAVIIALDTAEHAAFARQKSDEVKEAMERYAASLDVLVPWVYLNYADGSQDPLASYGAENLRYLREVSDKYDPTGFFQTSFPGGFTLARAG